MKIRYAFLTVVIVALSLGGYAQAYLSLSDDTMIGRDGADTTVDAYGIINNHQSRDLTVRWNRIVQNLPAGWESAVCDPFQCYLPHVSTKTFLLTADSLGTFHVSFYPNFVAGTGVVELEAYLEGPDSAISYIRGVYIGIADPVTGFEETFLTDNDDIKIYPNPVKDVILVRNLPKQQASTIEVYNIFGKKMLSFFNPVKSASSSIQKFDLESLPKGIYMIRIYDSFMNVILNKSISKVN